MYIGLHMKYPFLSSDFNETRIFSTDFLKIRISLKSVQWDQSSTDVWCGKIQSQRAEWDGSEETVLGWDLNRLAALETSSDSQDINMAWENIQQNIETSATETLGLNELK